jgi:hypothetical protein
MEQIIDCRIPGKQQDEIQDKFKNHLRNMVVSRSSVGRWKWQRGEQLFDLPDVVR